MFGQREALPRIPSQKKIPPPLRRDSATVAKDSGWNCWLKKLSVGEAVIVIAQLGGYLNRKCDQRPGFESLWKGHARFQDMAACLTLQKASQSKRRCPMRDDTFVGQAQIYPG